MSYNYNVRIEVPASQAEIAAKIGAALDPDSGGAASWNRTIIGYTEDKPANLRGQHFCEHSVPPGVCRASATADRKPGHAACCCRARLRRTVA